MAVKAALLCAAVVHEDNAWCAAGSMLELGRARAAETGCRLRPRAGGSDNPSSTGFAWADGWMAVLAFKKGLGHGQKGWLAGSGRPRCWQGRIGWKEQTLGVDERVALLCLLKWLRWDAVQRALQCMLPGLGLADS